MCCWVMDQDASGTEDAAKKWVETSNLAHSVAAIFNIDPYAVTPFPPEPLRVANAHCSCAQAHLRCVRAAGLLHLGSPEGAASFVAWSRATRRSRSARGRSLGCFACHAGDRSCLSAGDWRCRCGVAQCVSAGWGIDDWRAVVEAMMRHSVRDRKRRMAEPSSTESLQTSHQKHLALHETQGLGASPG